VTFSSVARVKNDVYSYCDASRNSVSHRRDFMRSEFVSLGMSSAFLPQIEAENLTRWLLRFGSICSIGASFLIRRNEQVKRNAVRPREAMWRARAHDVGLDVGLDKRCR